MSRSRRLWLLGPWLALWGCAESRSTPNDAAEGRLDAAQDAAPSDSDAGTLEDAEAVSDAQAPSDARVDDAQQGDAPAVRVQRYDYSLDLTSLAARSTLTLEPIEPGRGCVTLASEPGLRMLHVSDGFSAQQQDAQVSACGAFQENAAVQLNAELTLSAQAEPGTGVGFSRVLDSRGQPFSYLLSWLEECDRFGPCDPAPATLSQFTFSVTHDPAQTVLCPGVRESSGGTTQCKLLDTRAPTYSAFSLAARSGWQAYPLARVGDLDVIVYQLPTDTLHASLSSDAVARFIQWLSELLGPYPYGSQLRIATAPVQWLGMEHPANILVRDDLERIAQLYANVPLHTVLHEIAHQWAGNRTTLASTLDYAWKEAVSEYLVYAFEAAERPANEAVVTRQVWHRTGLGAFYPVRPLERPSVPLSVWNAGVYGSGPMTLFVQLEAWLGRAALLRAIQTFLHEPSARSVRDLQQAMEGEYGRSLQPYFDAWVYGRGEVEWPELRVTHSWSEGLAQLQLSQTHPQAQRFPCHVTLELRGATLQKRVAAEFTLDGQETTLELQIPFAEPLVSVGIDPDRELLDWSLPSLVPAPEVRFHP